MKKKTWVPILITTVIIIASLFVVRLAMPKNIKIMMMNDKECIEYIATLSDEEYEDLMKDLSEDNQARIRSLIFVNEIKKAEAQDEFEGKK